MTVALRPHPRLFRRRLGLPRCLTWSLPCCPRAMLSMCLVLSFFVASTPPAFASNERYLSLTYDVFYGGIKATSLEIDITLGDLAYRLKSKAVARGPFGWITGFIADAMSEGYLNDNDVSPREHNARSKWFGEQRSVALRPGTNGVVDTTVVPLPEKDDRDPVRLTSTIGTLDPLSASLKAARDIQRNDACEQTVPIFDGRRRYNLIFRDTIRTSIEGEHYSGPVLLCRLDLTRIAGFSRKPFMPRPKEPPEAFVWLARINPDVPPIPVRLQVDSSIATTVIHLTGVSHEQSDELMSSVPIEKVHDRVDRDRVR